MGIELRTLNEVMSWAKFLKGLGLITEDEFTVREYLDHWSNNDMKRNMISTSPRACRLSTRQRS